MVGNSAMMVVTEAALRDMQGVLVQRVENYALLSGVFDALLIDPDLPVEELDSVVKTYPNIPIIRFDWQSGTSLLLCSQKEGILDAGQLLRLIDAVKPSSSIRRADITSNSFGEIH